jgi:hypothetical protein
MPGKQPGPKQPGPWDLAPPRAERRSLAGIAGALVFSLALWVFLLIAALGLALKIAG